MTEDSITSAAYQDAALALIIEFRGGLPPNCDFCGQPFTMQRWAIPEEAGKWACSECYARWRPEGEL